MANPLICVFNPVTTLIDQIPSQSIFTGVSAAGSPVVLNQQGVLDPSLLGQGTSATAGELISSGAPLVNLYPVGGTLYMQSAFAAAVGTAPSGNPYPAPAVGFVANNVSINNSALVLFNGFFTYGDPNSEFGAADIGKEVYLSTVTKGGVTKTRPTGPGELQQTIGNVVGFQAPNFVQIVFIANPPAPALNNFDNIGTGTNTLATMTVGTGATLNFTGTGVVNANELYSVVISSTPPSVGQVLTATSPTAAHWAPASGGGGSTPGGANTSVQFNNTGTFDGDNNFKWDTTAQALTVNGTSASTFSVDAAANSSPKFQNLNYTVNNTGATVVNSKGTARALTYQASGNAIIVNQLTGDDLAVSNGTSSDTFNTILGSKILALSGGSSTIDGLIGQSIIVEPASTGPLTQAVGIRLQMVTGGQVSSIGEIKALDITGTSATNITGLTFIAGINVEDQGSTITGGTAAYGIIINPQTNGGWALFADGGRSFFADPILLNSSTLGPSISANNGSPEGVVTAPVSSVYLQMDDTLGGGGVWAKGTGAGNTGWVGLFPGGVNTNIQYNNNGAFGGDANFSWDPTAQFLTVNGGMGGTRNINTSLTGFYQFQNFTYVLTNTTGTTGDSVTGRNTNVQYAASSGGTNASVAGDSINVRTNGIDTVDSLTGSSIVATNSGGGTTTEVTGLAVVAVSDQGSVINLAGISTQLSLSAGSPHASNAIGIILSSQIGGGGFSSVNHLVGIDIKPVTFPVTSNVPLTEGILIEDQGVGIPINNNSATANALHILTQTVGSKAILVDGGQSQFNDTIIAGGGFATNLVTKTAAYTATSKDVTILGNGTFTVSLAPFSFTLTAATSGGATTTYTGTITGGGSNAYAGATFTITGFTNVHNNGTFICSASTSTTLVLINPNSTTETHAGTAAVVIVNGQLHRVKNISTGTITVASSANIDGLGTETLTQNQSVDVQWDGSTWWIL